MVQVIQRSEIGLVEPKSKTKFEKTPEGLAVHWEGTQVTQGDLEQSKKNLRAIQKAHMNNKTQGYVDIAYNLAFDHLGNIFVLRGWDIQSGANGNTAANKTRVAACYLGGPGQDFPIAAQDALREIRRIATEKGIGGSTKPHSAFIATQCPGDVIRNFIGMLDSSTPSKPTPAPTPQPSGGVPAFPGYARQGTKGPVATAWQQRLRGRGWNIVVDGNFGPKSTAILRQFQAEKGLVADGIGGPLSWNKLWTSPIS